VLDERPLVILIVDDNEPSLELAAEVLGDAGVVIITAADASEARDALARGGVDGVLLDMNLPGTDGMTLVAEWRRRTATRQLPVVALTAHAMRGDRERFLAGGCTGYIAKPIRVREFAGQALRELGLEHRSQARSTPDVG
jgi:CheY-like chemotaxis protein